MAESKKKGNKLSWAAFVNPQGYARQQFKIQDEERAALRSTQLRLMAEGDAIGYRAHEKAFKAGGLPDLNEEQRANMILMSIANETMKRIDPQAMKERGEPLPPPEAVISSERSLPYTDLDAGQEEAITQYKPTVEYYTRTPKGEQIAAATEASTLGSMSPKVVERQIQATERKMDAATPAILRRMTAETRHQMELNDQYLPPETKFEDEVIGTTGHKYRNYYEWDWEAKKWKFDHRNLIQLPLTKDQIRADKDKLTALLRIKAGLDKPGPADVAVAMMLENAKEEGNLDPETIAELEARSKGDAGELRKWLDEYIGEVRTGLGMVGETVAEPPATAPVADWVPDPNNPGRMIQEK